MGLDAVELVMAVESEFGFDIPNRDVARLGTVGAMYRYVAERLGEPVPPGAPAGPLWERLLDVVERDTGIDRRRLTPEARFIEDLGLD
jgi:acyl carrier protein